MDKELERRKKEAIKIAKDLWYSEEVLKKIELAKSEIEIDRILKTARNS